MRRTRTDKTQSLHLQTDVVQQTLVPPLLIHEVSGWVGATGRSDGQVEDTLHVTHDFHQDVAAAPGTRSWRGWLPGSRGLGLNSLGGGEGRLAADWQ